MQKAITKALTHLLIALGGTVIAATSTAAPTKHGNLLVTNFSEGTLTEYTRTGTVVQRFSIPRSTTSSSDLRDVVQGTDGRIHMFNGTFKPWMSTLDPTTGAVSNLTASGWSTVNNLSYGGIATLGSYVFVTDMFTYQGGEASGIIRFNTSNGVAERFSPENSYTDLTLGLDGKLYAGGSIFDPITMKRIGAFQLQGAGDVRGMAVDSHGNIYTASFDGSIQKRNAAGSLIASLSVGRGLNDIDIDSDGSIVVGSGYGDVYLTDSSLTRLTSFKTKPGTSFGPSGHVAFTSSVPEPSSFALLAVGLIGVSAGFRKRRQEASSLVS